jgi:putative transposase
MKTTIEDKLIDQILANYRKPKDLTGPEGLFTEPKKRLINRVLESELTTHLGYDKHERPPEEKPNARNGHSQKTLRSDDGELPIKIPALERG